MIDSSGSLCRDEKPGPYPALCHRVARHDDDHHGSYCGVVYTWDQGRTKSMSLQYTMYQDRMARLATDMDMAELIESLPVDTKLEGLISERLKHAADKAAEDFRDNGEEMLSTDDTAEVWDWAVETLLLIHKAVQQEKQRSAEAS